MFFVSSCLMYAEKYTSAGQKRYIRMIKQITMILDTGGWWKWEQKSKTETIHKVCSFSHYDCSTSKKKMSEQTKKECTSLIMWACCRLLGANISCHDMTVRHRTHAMIVSARSFTSLSISLPLSDKLARANENFISARLVNMHSRPRKGWR